MTDTGYAKIAATERAAFIVTVHWFPEVVSQPDQLTNEAPALGVAVSVTTEPLPKLTEHVPGQLMPAGLLITTPPFELTVSGFVAAVNVAVTPSGPVTAIAHEPVPLQAPLQPANVEPPVGVAVRVTNVPGANVPAHCGEQLMPGTSLVTVPVPVPASVTATG